MAGILTCSNLIPPSHPDPDSGICEINLAELTAADTVPDSHGIPSFVIRHVGFTDNVPQIYINKINLIRYND